MISEHDGKPIVDVPESGPLALIDKAVGLGLGADAIAKLWEIQKDIEDRNARQEFIKAMNLFKRNPPKIDKNKRVKIRENFSYDHATLDHACELIIPALAAVAISHRWETSQSDGVITVSCTLTHELGHSERTTLQGLPEDSGSKNKIQAVGSTVSYLERYTLLAAVGLATEGQDDDGKGGIKMPDFKERLVEIYSAQDHRSLSSIFQTHFNAAKDAHDEKAMFKFIEAKDERKAQLGK